MTHSAPMRGCSPTCTPTSGARSSRSHPRPRRRWRHSSTASTSSSRPPESRASRTGASTATTCSPAGARCGRGDHRIRRHRPVRRLRLERPRRAGVSAARSSWIIAAPSSCRCRSARPRSVTRRRFGALAAVLRAGHRSRRARRLLGGRGPRVRPRSARRAISAGSTAARAETGAPADQQRHAAAARHLPVRRRLRGDDDDDAAARARC